MSEDYFVRKNKKTLAVERKREVNRFVLFQVALAAQRDALSLLARGELDARDETAVARGFATERFGESPHTPFPASTGVKNLSSKSFVPRAEKRKRKERLFLVWEKRNQAQA